MVEADVIQSDPGRGSKSGLPGPWAHRSLCGDGDGKSNLERKLEIRNSIRIKKVFSKINSLKTVFQNGTLISVTSLHVRTSSSPTRRSANHAATIARERQVQEEDRNESMALDLSPECWYRRSTRKTLTLCFSGT